MAREEKYHFNKETLSFERIETTFVHIIKVVGIQLITSIIIGVLLFFVISWLFPTPLEKSLRKDNEILKNNYEMLDKRIGEMGKILDGLEHRDNNLYRVIFQAEPIENEARHLHNSLYENIDKMSNTQLLNTAINKTNDLAKQIYIQSKSYDELFNLSKKQEERLLCIPAIQPVLNKDLSRVASGFGYRNDPIYHTTRFHEGMDFTAPTGTDIYATGYGTVSFAGWLQGYGNCVKINHGFNYETLYAHQSKILVREGQKVKRGEIIGLVGSTGKSTAPHLHYEVHFKGVVQNPANYYFVDLPPADYDKMIELSQNSGHVLD
ncbi:MAG: M23 family metallopeptidase [Prevotellaceae bacterium]|jgi:murein DD-endopeptidase MepM/ murein hydrolase activator NlpD|nr:M23 family metallopeptidase [Prevotellaceae bacterium]